MKFVGVLGRWCPAIVLITVACGEGNTFDKARQANTIAGYEQYLADYPKGTFAVEARTAIDSIKAKAAFREKAADLAKRCKNYFEQFKSAFDKAPSGFELMTITFESQDLKQASAANAGLELASAVSDMATELGLVMEENKKLLDENKKLIEQIKADSSRFAQRFDQVQKGVGQRYLDYWSQRRDKVLAAVAAFITAVEKGR